MGAFLFSVIRARCGLPASIFFFGDDCQNKTKKQQKKVFSLRLIFLFPPYGSIFFKKMTFFIFSVLNFRRRVDSGNIQSNKKGGKK